MVYGGTHALCEVKLQRKVMRVGKWITAWYLNSLRQAEPVSTCGDQFQQMALASTVSPDDTHKGGIVLKPQLNALEMPATD